MARIVLVADDSPTIQKRALGILKGEGFEVETVSNGVAAIKRLAVLHPVVILADVSMPGRDGYEVCEFVKKSPEHFNVPVLLVASDMEPYDSARGAEVGADGIIKKPFEAQELISIVVKFADQFEAATTVIPAAPVAPSPTREPTQEFPSFSEEPDNAPTVVHHVSADFSAASGGVAFAQTTAEETPAFFPESHPNGEQPGALAAPPETAIFPEPAFEAPIAFTEGTPWGAEPPPAPSPFAPPPPFSPPRAPSFLGGLEAATPEPVFIEEQPAPAPEPAQSSLEARTLMFHAPLGIAEPVWKEAAVAAPPSPESAGPAGLEPQLEPAAPAAAIETPVEPPAENSHDVPAVTATSLDSFSLDDAAAGQVHFASALADAGPAEVVYSAPAEEVPVAVAAPPASPPEAVYPESAPPETTPQAADSAGPVVEALPEVVYTETSVPEPTPEAVEAQVATPPTEPEVVYTETTAPEPTPEAVEMQVAAPPSEPELAETPAAPAEPMSQAVHTEIGPDETVAEGGAIQIAPPEGLPESASPEPAVEAAAPLPTFNWDMLYSVIQKVVLRMSPPALSAECVEEITRRLADEIATEISTGAPQPRA